MLIQIHTCAYIQFRVVIANVYNNNIHVHVVIETKYIILHVAQASHTPRLQVCALRSIFRLKCKVVLRQSAVMQQLTNAMYTYCMGGGGGGIKLIRVQWYPSNPTPCIDHEDTLKCMLNSTTITATYIVSKESHCTVCIDTYSILDA